MASLRSCAAGLFSSHDGGVATTRAGVGARRGAAARQPHGGRAAGRCWPRWRRRSPPGRGTSGTCKQNGIGAAKLACDNAQNGVLCCVAVEALKLVEVRVADGAVAGAGAPGVA
jgi:hypothetical protein